MNVRIIFQSLICALAFSTIQCAAAATDDLPDSIRALLRDHIEFDKKSVGIVVGIVDERGSRVISYGHTDNGNSPEVNGDTLFDICSIGKTFTALLLQDMVERGEMKLDDPVAKYLPTSVRLPTRNGKLITLLDLATHTSGLPRDIGDLEPNNQHTPFSGYSIEQLYALLSSVSLRSTPGEKYEYSSLGMQLLGHVIELKAGTNYEALVRDRICRPLQMDNTCITLTPELEARLAPGHNPPNQSVPRSNFGPLPGAGGIRSTANDLLKYVSANLGLTKSALTPAMQKTHVVRISHANGDMDMALGWSVSHYPGAEFIGHSGRGIGYRALVTFDRKRRRGVVILSNSYDDDRLYNIGSMLLQSEWQPDKRPKPVRIDYGIYDAYVGQYQLATNSLIGIRRQGNRLLVQQTSQLTGELLPESETNFFSRIKGTKFTFIRDAHGNATRLVIHVDKAEYSAVKISNEPPKPPEDPKTHVAITIAPKKLNAMAGRYGVSDNESIIVKRDGNHLVVILGAESFEFFPEAESSFFCPYADLQIDFISNDKEVVTGLIAHVLGEREQKAKKL